MTLPLNPKYGQMTSDGRRTPVRQGAWTFVDLAELLHAERNVPSTERVKTELQ